MRNVRIEERPVLLDNGERLSRIQLDSVVYIEADHKQCVIFMADGQSHRLSYPLGSLLPSLPPVFVSVHRSYVINIWHVHSIYGTMIFMDNGVRLQMGKTYTVDALRNSFLIITRCR